MLAAQIASPQLFASHLRQHTPLPAMRTWRTGALLLITVNIPHYIWISNLTLYECLSDKLTPRCHQPTGSWPWSKKKEKKRERKKQVVKFFGSRSFVKVRRETMLLSLLTCKPNNNRKPASTANAKK